MVPTELRAATCHRWTGHLGGALDLSRTGRKVELAGQRVRLQFCMQTPLRSFKILQVKSDQTGPRLTSMAISLNFECFSGFAFPEGRSQNYAEMAWFPLGAEVVCMLSTE